MTVTSIEYFGSLNGAVRGNTIKHKFVMDKNVINSYKAKAFSEAPILRKIIRPRGPTNPTKLFGAASALLLQGFILPTLGHLKLHSYNTSSARRFLSNEDYTRGTKTEFQ